MGHIASMMDLDFLDHYFHYYSMNLRCFKKSSIFTYKNGSILKNIVLHEDKFLIVSYLYIYYID